MGTTRINPSNFLCNFRIFFLSGFPSVQTMFLNFISSFELKKSFLMFKQSLLALSFSFSL